MTNRSASFSSASTSASALIADNSDLLFHEPVTLIAGQNLVRGAVLGKISSAGTSVGTVTFVGTGNGTGTKASPAYGDGAQNGSYKAICVGVGADAGTFEVLRPDGTVDGVATVGVAYDGQVKFTIADGSTDFAAGDTFTIPVTVAAGSGKYTLSATAATDGSQTPAGILVDDTDASAGDKPVLIYTRGDFVASGLTLGTGHTTATVLAAFKDIGVFINSDLGGV